ncbi:MAG: glycosyltransferase family 39 protein [Microgenomates group bacterium]
MGYILSLALLLRLVFINQSLWLDESIEALALMGRLGPLMQYALADYQPPLYHLIGWVNTHLFGFSELVLRLPSLISGLFTVYFVTKIGELLGNKKVGMIVGLLAATSPLLIYYSGEGRTYAMTTFFVTASFYYLIQLISNKNNSKLCTLYYLLFTICFIYTSYLSWFLLLAEGIYVIYKKQYKILALQIIAASTLLFWLPSFIASIGVGQSTLSTSSAWGSVVGGLSWKSLPLTWVKFAIGRISFDNKIVYGLIVSLLALLHLTILKHLNLKKYPLLLIWTVVPVVLGIVVATQLPVFSYFRVMFVLPGYLLLLGLGLGQLKDNKLLLTLLSLNLIFLCISWVTPRFRHEDWRALSRDLSRENATHIAFPSRDQSTALLYYGISEDKIFEPQRESIEGSKIYYLKYAEDLFDVAGVGPAKLLESGYTITSQRVYPGIQLDIYENSH